MINVPASEHQIVKNCRDQVPHLITLKFPEAGRLENLNDD